MFCVLKYYVVDLNGMFTSFQGCQIRQSENACALQSWEKFTRKIRMKNLCYDLPSR